jgi:predicted nucleotidyltransferase
VLGLLLGRPDERFHLRQVARLAGTGLGPTQRELAALTGAGLVTREESGRQVYFQAERRSPLFPELQSLIQKTSGAVAVLREALRELGSQIRVGVIFGSVASGTMNRESDVDLLLLSDSLAFRDLARPIREASSRLGREVNVNLYRPSEWRARAAARHPLVVSVLENPRLAVIGDSHELERLAEERVGKASRKQSGGGQTTARRRGT